jgi:hypothetical protein
MSTQTDLKSDAFCIYNQSAAPLEWVLQKGQYYNTFAIGSVGVNAKANYVRPDVINIDSYLSGRDDILSKCNPPVPAIDEANEPPLTYQNQENLNYLQPIYSKEKKSSVNLAAVTYIPLTFSPDLFNPPQDLNHIIFNGQAQRGGADTRNVLKNAWRTDAFEYFLDPQRACGKYCSEANGYMTRLPYTKAHPEAEWGQLPKGLPSSRWNTPSATKTQVGRAAGPTPITSGLAVSVGAAAGNVPQLVVPTDKADPNDPRNRFMSHNKLPRIGNPYAAPPQMKNPATGGMYYSTPLQPLVPH